MQTTDSRVLLLTDIVGSTDLNDARGDDVMGRIWVAHDRGARDLMRQWRGIEIGRSDGFLIVFDSATDAVAFALAYHRSLGRLGMPIQARVGLHAGPVSLRENDPDDVAAGATPFEIDGIALPTAARVMAAARAGQTLVSASVARAIRPMGLRVVSHGHWCLKGLTEPLELFEVGDAGSACAPPADSPKAYRVVAIGGGWTAARELPHNLPAERDPFIGRADALQAITSHFEGGSRLVTLLGIGGIGKTRLSQRYARLWLGEYPGGAWFCDLSSARGQDGILHAVAHSLDVPLGRADAVAQLGAAIAGHGRCLVILDNFEQVTIHAERTLGAWMMRAPEARFMATSREVLGIAGEHAMPLEPLNIDDAIEMFRQRVRSAGQSADFAGEDEAALAPLVHLLDRLPLTVELAASRVRVMSPRLLLARMGDRFKWLAARGGRSERQSTLRATLDWSWDLLSAAEQSALAQLSVFEGGFTLGAVEAVLHVDEARHGVEPLDLLQALTEKSLVRRGLVDRFDMLRSVQDYAAERLGSADHPAMRRHGDYFAALGEAQATANRCADTDNLVLACRRAVIRGDAETAARLLANAWAALRLTGPFGVAARLAADVRRAAGLVPSAQAAADWVEASARHALGESREARRLLTHALGDTRLGPRGQVRLRCALGEVLSRGDDPAAAEVELNAALQSAIEHDDAEIECRAHNALGALAFERGRADDAKRHYEHALRLARQRHDLRWEGGLLGNLGLLCYSHGHIIEAQRHYERALEIADLLGDRRWEGNTRCNLGLLHQEQGRTAEALTQFEAALSMARRMGHRNLEGTVLCNLGILNESLADRDNALGMYRAAVEVARDTHDHRSEGVCRAHLGLLLARLGWADDARDCLYRGEALLRGVGDPVGQALLLCKRAIAERLSGDLPAARVAFETARDIAAKEVVSVDNELSKALGDAERCLADHGIDDAWLTAD